MEIRLLIIGRLALAASIAVRAYAQAPAPPPEPVPLPNERYGVIVVSVRANYLWPNTLTLPEGFYRVVVDDSSRLAPSVGFSIEDDRGNKLREHTTNGRGGRSEVRVRLARGRHRIRVGNRNEWILNITVEPGTTGGVR